MYFISGILTELLKKHDLNKMEHFVPSVTDHKIQMHALSSISVPFVISETCKQVSLDTFSHFVSSREGLFAINQKEWKLIIPGFFFGITRYNQYLFAFRSRDRPREITYRGEIIRFEIRQGTLINPIVIASGLDNGCHQIDFIGNRLCLLDTHQQRVLIFSEDFTSYQIQYPLKFAPFNHWAYGYVHFNSFIAVGDCIYLVLHNGGVKTGRPSCLVVCDLEWRIIRRLLLPGLACHNIAFFDKNQPIICGSLHGELINFHGRIAKIDPAMTRGVSLNKHEIVVGAYSGPQK